MESEGLLGERGATVKPDFESLWKIIYWACTIL